MRSTKIYNRAICSSIATWTDFRSANTSPELGTSLTSDALLQLASSLEIHGWKTKLDTNSRRDHAEIVEFFADIKNGQSITDEAVAQNNALLTQIMTLMQNVGHQIILFQH